MPLRDQAIPQQSARSVVCHWNGVRVYPVRIMKRLFLPDRLSRIVISKKIAISVYMVIRWIAVLSFLRFCIYLASTNCSAKLTANVVYLSTAAQSPYSESETLPLSSSHSPSQFSPARSQPRATSWAARVSPYAPKPGRVIQTSQS